MSRKHRMAKRAVQQEIKQDGFTRLNDPNDKKDQSPYVHQRDKVNWNLSIRERNDWTEKQRALIELILDKETKVLFLKGVAGTAKTFCSIYCGLHLLNQRRISDLVYVRSIIESASRSLGSLPGESSNKMQPFLMPLFDKLSELLPDGDIKKLNAEDRIKGIPINFLRGASLNAQYIIIDEAQNLDYKELTTAITRLGKYSKIIICGDPDQSDLNGRSGFLPMFDLFDDESSREQGIFCLSLTKDDIVRSGILRYIIERIEWGKANQTKK